MAYPCHRQSTETGQPPPCVEWKAHAAHVTAVAWTADGAKLMTVGSPDLCTKQWRVRRRKRAATGSADA